MPLPGMILPLSSGSTQAKTLSVFFRQWIDEKGLPELRVENAAIRRSGSAFEVSFDAVQKGKVYALEVPITVSFVRGGEKRQILKARLREEEYFPRRG